MGLVASVGCSSADEGGAGASGLDLEGNQGFDSAHDDPWADSAAGAEDDTGGGEGADPESLPSPLDVGGGSPPPVDDAAFATCPQSLPDGWVMCEDFESIIDPSEVALDYQSLEETFVLVDDVGASGHRSMEVTYREGEEGAGWMVLSFGRSPIHYDDRPTYAPEVSFSEVYWRLRVMTEAGWPDVGPGPLTRTISFAGDDWAEAVVAQLQSAGDGVALEAVPVTCVSGDEVMCAGFDDEASLEPLGTLAGAEPVYAEHRSGQWQCIEGRLRLNERGESDGVLEFWVDGKRQAGRDNLDLRGTWDDYGINALVIENRWPGGAPAPLRRWVDDVVISTQPIGCSDPVDDAIPG